jgi:hypothetical protein
LVDIHEVVENSTLCHLFGVANMGGIRVNKSRNLIVLISNNTDPTYRNEWKDGLLHFVGMGSIGPQKLDRQNRTLANSKRNGTALHLFEVFEKSRYVYAGEVELADEPYISDQPDARAEGRFVWIFPLRRMATTGNGARMQPDDGSADHLSHRAYAVIGSDLTEEQTKLVNEALDRLKVAGVPVTDQRDIDQKRYETALAGWHAAVLVRVRSTVREMIKQRKQMANEENRSSGLVDDELKINSASSEEELRDALKFLDRDDPITMQEVFEEARRCVPMPELPRSLHDLSNGGPMDSSDLRAPRVSIGHARFKDFT